MKTEKYRFVIQGTGLIAAFHARAIQELTNAQLVGFCGRTAEKAQKLADAFNCSAYTSLDRALDNADILCIATASGLHLEGAVAAARRGKHALVEKPLEITTARIDQMIAAHRASGTRLGCIFQLRHIPALQPIRKALQEGRFGTVTHVGVHVPWWREQAYYNESTWHGKWELDGGGALMNQAIHMIDLLLDLFPMPDTVKAVTSSVGHGIETEDAAVVALKWNNGMLGVIHGTTSAWPGNPRRLEIFGTEGAVVLTDNTLTQYAFKQTRPEDAEILSTFGGRTETGAGASAPGAMTHAYHTECFKAFIQALENNDFSDANALSARRSVALIQQVYVPLKILS
jgi:UDP-N-acetyl-2-amino-2-deoxyglucuronate dehydrogenase